MVVEGEAGAGRAACGVFPGQPDEPGRLGGGQDDRGDRGRAGQPKNGRDHDGAGVYLQASAGDVIVFSVRGRNGSS